MTDRDELLRALNRINNTFLGDSPDLRDLRACMQDVAAILQPVRRLRDLREPYTRVSGRFFSDLAICPAPPRPFIDTCHPVMRVVIPGQEAAEVITRFEAAVGDVPAAERFLREVADCLGHWLSQ